MKGLATGTLRQETLNSVLAGRMADTPQQNVEAENLSFQDKHSKPALGGLHTDSHAISIRQLAQAQFQEQDSSYVFACSTYVTTLHTRMQKSMSLLHIFSHRERNRARSTC